MDLLYTLSLSLPPGYDYGQNEGASKHKEIDTVRSAQTSKQKKARRGRELLENEAGSFSRLQSLRCSKGDPFQDPRVGSGLTLGDVLPEETHALTEETLLGRGARVESRTVREPRRTALPPGSQSGVLWPWDSFPGCFWPITGLRVLPGGAHAAQPRWTPARRILGGGRTRGVSF